MSGKNFFLSIIQFCGNYKIWLSILLCHIKTKKSHFVKNDYSSICFRFLRCTMLRTALLWGNTINLDSDYSKYIETVSDPWVIEGFAVENGKVKPGKAWVKVTRSNGESLFVLVQNTQDIPVSLNGDVFIGIEVAQNAIDNGLMNNEDGTGIASIKVWPQKPNQNYLLLAVWQGGGLSDKREIIPKLQSLSQRTTTLEAKVQQTEGKIEKLVESSIPEFIGKVVVVGEAYKMGDILFERGGRAYNKGIKVSRPNFNRTGLMNYGMLQLFEIDVPEGKDFKIIMDSIRANTSSTIHIWSQYSQNESNLHNEYGIIYQVHSTSEHKNWWVQKLVNFSWGKIYLTAQITWYLSKFDMEWIRIEGVKESWGAIILYPREVKGIGEKVECTIMGLHSNGDLIQPRPVEIILDKEMSGTFTTSREAPNSWYLELTYRTGSRQSQYGWINIWERWLDTSEGNRSERIFVKKWPIVLKWWGREGYAINTYLKLEKFTSVM